MGAAGRRLLGLLLAGAAAPAARGWVLFPAETLQKNGVKLDSIESLLNHSFVERQPPLFRWTVNADMRREDGLNGGVSYAFDPEFCARMLPLFSEGNDVIRFYEFVNCDLIKEVVASALRTWSANNRNVYFTDVTRICDARKLWRSTAKATCTSLTCRRCALAELVVTVFDSLPGDHSGARAQPEASRAPPLGTNLLAEDGGSFEFVNLEFGTNLCWYVDATFCGFFHQLEADGLPVLALVGVTLGACFLAAAALAAYALWRLLKLFLYTMLATWDTDQDGVIELWELIGGGRALLGALRHAIK